MGPERRVTSMTWAWTQMAPQRSTHPLTALTTHARERGLSAVFGSAMGDTLSEDSDSLQGVDRARGVLSTPRRRGYTGMTGIAYGIVS